MKKHARVNVSSFDSTHKVHNPRLSARSLAPESTLISRLPKARIYDAIVIGARCAGAVTAMLLARRGYRVLLLERDIMPSDVHQGHFIHLQGPKRLADWGLLERVVATNCPPIVSQLTDFGDFPLIGRDIRVGSLA
jgi:FAD binding domain